MATRLRGLCTSRVEWPRCLDSFSEKRIILVDRVPSTNGICPLISTCIGVTIRNMYLYIHDNDINLGRIRNKLLVTFLAIRSDIYIVSPMRKLLIKHPQRRWISLGYEHVEIGRRTARGSIGILSRRMRIYHDFGRLRIFE